MYWICTGVNPGFFCCFLLLPQRQWLLNTCKIQCVFILHAVTQFVALKMTISRMWEELLWGLPCNNLEGILPCLLAYLLKMLPIYTELARTFLNSILSAFSLQNTYTSYVNNVFNVFYNMFSIWYNHKYFVEKSLHLRMVPAVGKCYCLSEQLELFCERGRSIFHLSTLTVVDGNTLHVLLRNIVLTY